MREKCNICHSEISFVQFIGFFPPFLYKVSSNHSSYFVLGHRGHVTISCASGRQARPLVCPKS